ncbi:hypothetical protein ANCCAN_27755 [Ancylostoma caninum]|uniref:Uncharacterized protein n=1 Tax=Ancylostoma caninum TaxID=29170 RepID=A0A368F4F8_ANCCA|nr:hypothetical protein ANCCAN_27755 [Ancylostoma caninum]
MGELETERDALEHFVASGRAGRRNALPEIEPKLSDSFSFYTPFLAIPRSVPGESAAVLVSISS